MYRRLFALALLMILPLTGACGQPGDAEEPTGQTGTIQKIIATPTGYRPKAVVTGGDILYRINVGGPSLTSVDAGPNWSGDTAASPSVYGNASATGNHTYATSSAVSTSDPSIPAGTPAAVFQTERWDPAPIPEMQWDFPVDAGEYVVELFFAEIYSGTQAVGARVFNVYVEGTLVLDKFDIYAEAGGYKGVVKSFSITADSNLDIDFGHVTENPALKAIQIRKITSSADSTAVYRVNAGGAALTAGDGQINWAADTHSSPSPYVNAAETGNYTWSNTATIDMSHSSIPAHVPESLFKAERWDPSGGSEMQWDFPLNSGTYEVRLYFAEIYSGTQSNGARVFDVYIDGTLVLENYDIYAEVGGYTAVMKSFLVTSDGNLDIDFGHVKENPAIKGIEIIALDGDGGTTEPTPIGFGKSAPKT